MYATTYYMVKQRLYELMAASPAFAGVSVTYGMPVPSDGSGYEVAYMGHGTGTLDPTALRPGRQAFDEDYYIDVQFEVLAEGVDTQQQADARVKTLWDGLAQLLGEDPKLGTTEVMTAVIRRFETDGGPWERGYYAEAKLGINIRAKLR